MIVVISVKIVSSDFFEFKFFFKKKKSHLFRKLFPEWEAKQVLVALYCTFS